MISKLENQVKALIQTNIQFLDEIIEINISQIMKNENIDLSDEKFKEKLLLIAKQTYFAG